MTLSTRIAAAVFLAAAILSADPLPVRNVVVYKTPGRYAGWPANHGIWNWGDEILVGFESGQFKVNRSIHARDCSQKGEHLLARDSDGGGTGASEQPLASLPRP